MNSKRLLLYLVLAVFAAGGAYLLFGSSKERRVLAVLREMAAALSTQAGESPTQKARRVELACREHLSEQFVFTAPEVGTIDGRESVATLAALGPELGLTLEIKDSSVRVGDGKRARASLLVEVTFRPTGEERRERRSATVELVERGDRYVIERVEVAEPSREEPEARP